jgi:hypothetical protein
MLATTTALAAALAATPVLAQTSEPAPPGSAGLGFGVKAGFGISPDQFVIGAQYSLGKSLGVFRLVPNAHLGFGDVTTFDLNFDFLLRLIAKDSGFGFFGGAAPTFITGNDDSEFGITLVGGVQVPLIKNRATNLEARFGITDKMPDFRLLVSLIL